MSHLHRRSLHEGWEFIRADVLTRPPGYAKAVPMEWLPATVPGHVHIDLVDNGVIAHPFEQMHELGCQWVDETDWVYRTRFDWKNEGHANVELLFHGLDTIADVSLNGQPILESRTMHAPASFMLVTDGDVSPELKEGENELRIHFRSALAYGRAERERYFQLHSLRRDMANFGPEAFVRKAQYMFGWDWGPELASCGIWQPVEILSYEERITTFSPLVLPAEGDDFFVDLWTETTGGEGLLEFEQDIPGAVLEESEDEEGNLVSRLAVKDPARWWPHGMGEQTLFPIAAVLKDANGREIDRVEHKIGFRTIDLVREPDEMGESFGLRVNGQPVFACGANWIPDHSFPSQITRDQMEEQIAGAKALNFNMLRVWGGGLFESEDFYELCDEAGIMVWQDFPHACSYYPESADFVEICAEEADFNIKRLRRRASLAMWCGNNENSTMFDGKWGGAERNPDRHHGEYLYNIEYPQQLEDLDPARPYIPTSPIGQNPKSEHPNANDDGYGDSHYWDVWHGRGDWKFYSESTSRFSSEFGFCSSMSLEAWGMEAGMWALNLEGAARDEDDDATLNPRGPLAKWHDKTRKGYDVYLGMVELHYPHIRTIHDLVYYTQLNQRDALRHGIEHYRTADFCEGTLIWQYNDCWPVQSWAVRDSAKQIKPAGWELARLYAPVVLSIVKHEGRAELKAAAHNGGSVPRSLSLRAIDLTTGKVVAEGSDSLDTSSLDSTRVLLWGEAEGVEPVWRLLGEPKDLQLGEPATIRARMEADAIVLETSLPVVDLWAHQSHCIGGWIDMVVTSPQAGQITLRGGSNSARFTPDPDAPSVDEDDARVLRLRSLAGEHPIDWV
jgi:beta-mannosidase